MRINNNMMAMNTHRQLGVANNAGAKSMEKLSSGMRINRAGDDAAGLAISEKMRGQIRGLNQASANAQDGISMIQTAEGALNETHAILQRMRELSVQASTDVLDGQDNDAIGDEMVALRDEINRIGETTDFNGKKLLNGSLAAKLTGAATFKEGAAGESGKSTVANVDVSRAAAGTTFTVAQGTNTDELKISSGGVDQTIKLTDGMFDTVGKNSVLDFDKIGIKITLESNATDGTAVNAVTALKALTLITDAGSSTADIVVGANATANETINIAFSDMRSTALNSDVGALNKASMDTVVKAKAMTVSLDDAIKNVSTQRSNLGAIQNRLEYTIKNLDTSSENTQAAEARIRDVDMAKEMMEQTKQNILAQASTAMLANANQAPQAVLQLLR